MIPHLSFVSVIIPHYEDLDRLDLCLDALSRQSLPKDRFELIVADNNSPVGVEAVSKTIAGRARLVVVQEKGAGPARNGGIAAAAGNVLAFTDSDCLPDPDWLLAGMQALSDCDFVGGAMKVLVDDVKSMTPAEAFEYLFAFDNKFYVEMRNFTVTANLFCSRDIFNHIGGFHVGVSEDIEWSHRAIEYGYRIGYAPQAVIWHPARKNWIELRKKWSRINTELYHLYMSKKNGIMIYIFFILSQIPYSIINTPKIIKSKELKSVRDKISVVSILYRLRFIRFTSSILMLIRLNFVKP